MRDSDRPRFAVAINALAALYNREVSEALLHGFWLGLRDLPIEVVERGAARAMRESKFMPAPIEIRELSGETKDADRSLLAWSHFERAVVAYGANKSVDFDDTLINATVRHLGGWVRCCDLSPEEFDTWLRKDFLRAYEAFCRTGVSAEAGAALVGVHQRENRILGYDDAATAQLAPGCAGDPLRIATGLPPHRSAPALPDRTRRDNVPLVEFKRP